MLATPRFWDDGKMKIHDTQSALTPTQISWNTRRRKARRVSESERKKKKKKINFPYLCILNYHGREVLVVVCTRKNKRRKNARREKEMMMDTEKGYTKMNPNILLIRENWEGEKGKTTKRNWLPNLLVDAINWIRFSLLTGENEIFFWGFFFHVCVLWLKCESVSYPES